jgi:hypothetical protein
VNPVSGFARAAAAVFRRYPYRGKTFLWNRLEGLVRPQQLLIRQSGGGLMLVDTRLFWQRQMMAACFERAGAWVVPRLLRKGDVFVDGGANCGYYSCLASGRVTMQGAVIAFEPDPRLHAQLRRQRELNRGIIRVEAYALSDHDGTATFHINPGDDPQGVTIGHGSLEPQPGWEQVEVLMKLDLEGHEYQALEGAKQSIASGAIESLLVEVNDRRTAALLLSLPWEEMVIVGKGWRTVDPSTLGTEEADVLCLRGECAKRFRALRGMSKFV